MIRFEGLIASALVAVVAAAAADEDEATFFLYQANEIIVSFQSISNNDSLTYKQRYIPFVQLEIAFLSFGFLHMLCLKY